jgi:hypothetical protein
MDIDCGDSVYDLVRGFRGDKLQVALQILSQASYRAKTGPSTIGYFLQKDVADAIEQFNKTLVIDVDTNQPVGTIPIYCPTWETIASTLRQLNGPPDKTYTLRPLITQQEWTKFWCLFELLVQSLDVPNRVDVAAGYEMVAECRSQPEEKILLMLANLATTGKSA